MGEDIPDEEETNDGIVVMYNGQELPISESHLKDLEKWLSKRDYI